MAHPVAEILIGRRAAFLSFFVPVLCATVANRCSAKAVYLSEEVMTIEVFKAQPRESAAQRAGRWLMGAAMVFAGISHLTFARRAFRKQVPRFATELSPLSVDQIVVWSGVVEISMGAAVLLLPKQRKVIGWILAGFYVAIFPGNIAQWKHNRSAFGLDTDEKRFWRLFAQPGLIAGALWSTGALDNFRSPQQLESQAN